MRGVAVCRVSLYALLFSVTVGVCFVAEANTEKCSEKFVGTVMKVSSSEAPFSSRGRNQVKFKVAHSKDGAFTPTRSIQIKSNLEEYKFQKGQSYRVSLSGNKLCHAQFIAVR